MPQLIQVLNPDIAEYVGSLVYTDAAGNPAKVDGVPVLTSASSNATLTTTSEDGLGLSLKPVAPIVNGDESAFAVVADADLGEGVKPLPLDIRIIWSREATNVGLSFQPAPPTP